MTLTSTLLREFEHDYRKPFPADLKKYLVNYAHEPFPHEFTEQDLYANIEQDIRKYEAGKLDVRIKSPSERWHGERIDLQNLYIEKCREVCALKEYVAELEHMLLEHGLKFSERAELRKNYETERWPF